MSPYSTEKLANTPLQISYKNAGKRSLKYKLTKAKKLEVANILSLAHTGMFYCSLNIFQPLFLYLISM